MYIYKRMKLIASSNMNYNNCLKPSTLKENKYRATIECNHEQLGNIFQIYSYISCSMEQLIMNISPATQKRKKTHCGSFVTVKLFSVPDTVKDI